MKGKWESISTISTQRINRCKVRKYYDIFLVEEHVSRFPARESIPALVDVPSLKKARITSPRLGYRRCRVDSLASEQSLTTSYERKEKKKETNKTVGESLVSAGLDCFQKHRGIRIIVVGLGRELGTSRDSLWKKERGLRVYSTFSVQPRPAESSVDAFHILSRVYAERAPDCSGARSDMTRGSCARSVAPRDAHAPVSRSRSELSPGARTAAWRDEARRSRCMHR